ncbi:hypothetical protein H5410_057319 [Solanum commersonii]|uniref:Uncharacterized protein n=1 Tax=Solanum commersonii TaxID=4109 RepID=A0A9J5WMP5_SOLCO|nr:hypothetical protein H5410_057319 [Solanum commersonii]
MLKSNIESCGMEINSLKYELHINSKELEIRNEEKNMSVWSADEMSVRKTIRGVGARCLGARRLKGLWNKEEDISFSLSKQQIKKPIESYSHLTGLEDQVKSLEEQTRITFGWCTARMWHIRNLKEEHEQKLHDVIPNKANSYSGLQQKILHSQALCRSPCKEIPRKAFYSPQFSSLPDFPFDSVQKFHKENEQLTEHLLAMEEETKMLKEALAHRNSEDVQQASEFGSTAAIKF